MQRILWCYAHETNGVWQAICVDLDIAVQGKSFDEVKKLLELSVETYIDTARNESPEVRRQLLSRRAPFWLRTRLALTSKWRGIWHRDDGDDPAGFSVPCHA